MKNIKAIIEDIKNYKWNVLSLWIEDNCIYTEVKKLNGNIEVEKLYSGKNFDKSDICNVYIEAKNKLNNIGILV